MSGDGTFSFPRELGERLRGLRERAGLSQQELVERMGRSGRNARTLVSRLEKGGTRFPTLALVADFLRGCGAGFEDIRDILDRYTAQGPVPRARGTEAVAELTSPLPRREAKAVRDWDLKRAIAHDIAQQARPRRSRRRLSPDERVERVLRMYDNRKRRQAFDDRMLRELEDPGSAIPRGERDVACEYGRRLFDRLCAKRGDPDAGAKALARLRRRYGRRGLAGRSLAAAESAATEAFEELDKAGAFDTPPTKAMLEKPKGRPRLFSARRAEVRLSPEQKRYREALGRAYVLVAVVIDKLYLSPGSDVRVQTALWEWARRVFGIVVDTEPGGERDERVAQQAAGLGPVTREWIDGHTAEVVRKCELLKADLPPKPEED